MGTVMDDKFKDLERYEIKCAHIDSKTITAEIKYKCGVRIWYKDFLKGNLSDIPTNRLIKDLQHLTVWYTGYIEGTLRFMVSDAEGSVVHVYVFRSDEFDPLITIRKNW